MTRGQRALRPRPSIPLALSWSQQCLAAAQFPGISLPSPRFPTPAPSFQRLIMEGKSQTGLTPPRLSHSHLEPGGSWEAEMKDINEGGGQARAWSPMRTSSARRGGFVLKGQRYPSLRVGAGALGLGHGMCCSGRSSRNSRGGAPAAPRVLAICSLEPSFSFSSLTCSGRGPGSGFRFVLTIHMANKTIPN